MARTARSTNVVHPEFASVVKKVLTELLEDRNDLETCVSADVVAAHKRVAAGFHITHHAKLKELVLMAVSCGQVVGFTSRVGRDGGIHRVKTQKRKYTRSAKPEAEVASTPSNDSPEPEVVEVAAA